MPVILTASESGKQNQTTWIGGCWDANQCKFCLRLEKLCRYFDSFGRCSCTVSTGFKIWWSRMDVSSGFKASSRRQDDGWGCPQYHEVSTELQYAWSRRDVAPAGLTRGCPKKTSGLRAAGLPFVPTPSPLSFHILTIHLDWKGPGSILIHK